MTRCRSTSATMRAWLVCSVSRKLSSSMSPISSRASLTSVCTESYRPLSMTPPSKRRHAVALEVTEHMSLSRMGNTAAEEPTLGRLIALPCSGCSLGTSPPKRSHWFTFSIVWMDDSSCARTGRRAAAGSAVEKKTPYCGVSVLQTAPSKLASVMRLKWSSASPRLLCVVVYTTVPHTASSSSGASSRSSALITNRPLSRTLWRGPAPAPPPPCPRPPADAC
mmetsp:Transcript_8081/g.25365  ORF Transcript_8081/g.25365 Transcript_8081/m.25365 type:complete len:222 (-) Transcript_8081:70-735(-)